LAARSALKRFWRDEAGATSIEYCLIASLIFVVIVTMVTSVGGKTGIMYDKISATVSGAIGG
jgi:pilus assembly protein Flp/PilA